MVTPVRCLFFLFLGFYDFLVEDGTRVFFWFLGGFLVDFCRQTVEEIERLEGEQAGRVESSGPSGKRGGGDSL